MNDRNHESNPFSAHENDIDESLLDFELSESRRPTSQAQGLELTVLWGDTVLDSVVIKAHRPISVRARAQNRSGKADLEVDGFPADKFTIATNYGDRASIVVPAGAKVGLRGASGEMSRDVVTSEAEAPFEARAYPLEPNERLVYKTGTLTVMAEFVRADAVLGATPAMNWFFPRILAISVLLHVFFVAAAFMTPRVNDELAAGLLTRQVIFAKRILTPVKDIKKPKRLDLSGVKDAGKHKDEAGKFGRQNEPKESAAASKPGAPRIDPHKRERDRRVAEASGLLSMLVGGEASAVSSVMGPGGIASGINVAMGGLTGPSLAMAGGVAGLNSRGARSGGGGDSLSIGGLPGSGRGNDGTGKINLGGRGKSKTRIVPGRTHVVGSLSKAEISREIRRNLPRFKHCYEKQLNSNPNLEGKVAVYFTIAPNGRVARASARESSMDNKKVVACTIKVMRSLEFPKPRGGGVVVVTYPFLFAST